MGRSAHSVAEACGAPLVRLAAAACACLLLANCTGPLARIVDPKYGVAASPRVIEDGRPIPRGGGFYRVGDPYTIAGRTYVPQVDPSYSAEGVASWYGADFHGRRTANGEIYDMHAISAAHPTLPIPSYARVTHLGNRRSIVVRVNDRGPFKDGRIIDLSKRSADLLGFRGNGLARVRVEYVGRASLDGSDDRVLLATLRRDGRPAPAPSAVMLAAADGPVMRAAAAPDRRPAPIPAPPYRPFDLDEEPAAEPAGFPAQMAAAGPVAPRAALSGPVPAPPPVAADAGRAPGLLTGRGLY